MGLANPTGPRATGGHPYDFNRIDAKPYGRHAESSYGSDESKIFEGIRLPWTDHGEKNHHFELQISSSSKQLNPYWLRSYSFNDRCRLDVNDYMKAAETIDYDVITDHSILLATIVCGFLGLFVFAGMRVLLHKMPELKCKASKIAAMTLLAMQLIFAIVLIVMNLKALLQYEQ